MLATAHVFSPLKPDRETPTRAGLAACFSTFTATDLEAMMLTNCDAIRSVYNPVASYLIWSLDDWQEARKGQCWCAGGLSFPGRSARNAYQKSADRSEEDDCVSSRRRSACSLAGSGFMFRRQRCQEPHCHEGHISVIHLQPQPFRTCCVLFEMMVPKWRFLAAAVGLLVSS